jgi:beta-phosphoglucomutase
MLKRTLKGAIFDLDGVIVDSVPLHYKAWQRTFADYGKEFSFEEYKEKVDGIPTEAGVRAVLGDCPSGIAKEAGRKKQGYYLRLLSEEGIDVYKDTLNLINEFKENKLRLGVISSSKLCRQILEKTGILGLFQVVIGGNDITKGKPDPEIFFLASERMEVGIKECLVFEDAVLGVAAGVKGGFFTVGVDRYNNPTRLNQADLVVTSLDQVDLRRLNNIIEKK